MRLEAEGDSTAWMEAEDNVDEDEAVEAAGAEVDVDAEVAAAAEGTAPPSQK